MSRSIAVIDTDVIILALDTTANAAVQTRRAYIDLAFQQLDRQNATYLIPAPVVAELCGRGPGDTVIRELVRVLTNRIRIQALDEDAALVAGEIARTTLRNRGGRERGAVKFDSLIFGLAHQIGARWLVTGNGPDYLRCKQAISSPVEIMIATEPPPTGQQVMVQVLGQPVVLPAPALPQVSQPSTRAVPTRTAPSVDVLRAAESADLAPPPTPPTPTTKVRK